ncbi:class I glutamine amidotransferase-like protein [Cyathus striatus]|nr:class I glutamine amidotransferase-like protein [Cyathus striatus]
MPSALILIADGTEEMEFTITYDTLVRGGLTTTSAFVPEASSTTTGAISPRAAKGSRGINIMPDVYLDPTICGPDKYDLLVIPGGAKGADTMSKSEVVQGLVRRYLEQKKFVGMICAGSLAAKTAKLPKQRLTSHPSVKSELESAFDYSEAPVVVSGCLVTSRGPGTAFPFALTLVELLCGTDKRAEIRAPMVFPDNTPF